MAEPVPSTPLLIEAAGELGIPAVDAICIALNLYGVANGPNGRHRMLVRPLEETNPFLIITPTGKVDSPIFMADGRLWLGNHDIAEIVDICPDDVVAAYLRADDTRLTLNTNHRSTCTGCVFCPNVIEAPADTIRNAASELGKFLDFVIADRDWDGLAHLEKISVCTGCFDHEDAAVAHMVALGRAACTRGFTGNYHLLSSVLRSRDGLKRCVDELGSFHLTLTLECVTRRTTVLRASKADLDLDACIAVMERAAQADAFVDVTYIAGLDPYDVAVDALLRLAEVMTTFPRIQVFQVHNDLMEVLRSPGAHDPRWFFQLRSSVEPALARRGLRPLAHENYRPLWYTAFAGRPIQGPRV